MKHPSFVLLAAACVLATDGLAQKKGGPGCNVVSSAMGRTAKDQPWSMKVTVKAVGLAAGQSCDRIEVATEDGKVLHTQPIAGGGAEPIVTEFKLASIPEGTAVLQVRSVMKPAGESGRVSKLKVPGAKKPAR